MNSKYRLTLNEMAQRLNRCPKTFRKYIVEYRIPHIRLGRDMLFDANEVENFLSHLTMINQAAVHKNQRSAAGKVKTKLHTKNKTNNRYASLLGLS